MGWSDTHDTWVRLKDTCQITPESEAEQKRRNAQARERKQEKKKGKGKSHKKAEKKGKQTSSGSSVSAERANVLQHARSTTFQTRQQQRQQQQQEEEEKAREQQQQEEQKPVQPYAVGDFVLVEQDGQLLDAQVLQLGDGQDGEDVYVRHVAFSADFDSWAELEQIRCDTAESRAEQARRNRELMQKRKTAESGHIETKGRASQTEQKESEQSSTEPPYAMGEAILVPHSGGLRDAMVVELGDGHGGRGVYVQYVGGMEADRRDRWVQLQHTCKITPEMRTEQGRMKSRQTARDEEGKRQEEAADVGKATAHPPHITPSQPSSAAGLNIAHSHASSLCAFTCADRPAKKQALVVPPAASDMHLCVVCGRGRREMVMQPCDHLCLCFACAVGVQKGSVRHCPICGVAISDSKRVYF